MTPTLEAMAREAGTSAATAEAAMRVGFADIQRGRLVFINDKMGEMLIEFAALVRAQALEDAALVCENVYADFWSGADDGSAEAAAAAIRALHTSA